MRFRVMLSAEDGTYVMFIGTHKECQEWMKEREGWYDPSCQHLWIEEN